MNKDQARELLKSPDADERLTGARYFAGNASASDERVLSECLRREEVSWTRNALQQGLRRASGEIEKDIELPTSTNATYEDWREEIKASAIEETTKLLLHEIEPIIGTMRFHAERELPTESCETLRQIDRLDRLLEAIATLSQAAAAPRIVSFDLHELIDLRCEEEAVPAVVIGFAGRQPMVIESDPGLISIALVNGLKNAIEATVDPQITGSKSQPITVTWGDSDRDIWISIADRGAGFLPGIERVWDIGSTTKKDHFGMGLSLARRAMRSLGGDVKLAPREDGGVRFEMRWPNSDSAN